MQCNVPEMDKQRLYYLVDLCVQTGAVRYALKITSQYFSAIWWYTIYTFLFSYFEILLFMYSDVQIAVISAG